MLQVLVKTSPRRATRTMSAPKLEQWRSRLNHDLLKNQFLERLGTVQGAIGENELKVKLIRRAWGQLNGRFDPEAAPSQTSVEEALRQWPVVRKDLVAFFSHGPEDCDMIRTPLFDRIAEDCLREPNGWLAILDGFVRDFKDLAFSTPALQEQRLRQFWEAAESLHRALSEMRPRFGGEGPRFGDFFCPKTQYNHGSSLG
jgi:hypothetical protein